MAQEDRGLVLRGLLLLSGIIVLVAVVLGILFWRPHTPPPTIRSLPEHQVPAIAVPHIGEFPGNISWFAIYEAGQTMPSAPGWDIRYNAAGALARRGSDKVPWPILREMLDEKQQMRNNRVRVEGRDVYDEAAARVTLISALKAIAAWHEKRKDQPNRDVPPELRDIYPVVDALAKSEFVELRVQAEKTRATFFR
jgi:hypothetical protein